MAQASANNWKPPSNHDFGVGGATKLEALTAKFVEQVDGVGQVAVVGKGEFAAVIAPDRLGVFPGPTTGG